LWGRVLSAFPGGCEERLAHSFAISPSSRVSSPGRTLGFQSPSIVVPQIKLVEVACGLPWAVSKCWGGLINRDHRSYAQVLKQRCAHVIMVPPRRPRGWGRSGFSAGRAGRGAGRTNRQGMTWYHQEWHEKQGRAVDEAGEGGVHCREERSIQRQEVVQAWAEKEVVEEVGSHSSQLEQDGGGSESEALGE
jgi:hypothetical protein